MAPSSGGATLQLTVGTHGLTTSTHPDSAAAQRHLVDRAVTGDYYLRTLEATPTRTAYQLLSLTRDRHRPRMAGHAVIETTGTEADAR